jgi:hypothetical protein
LLKQSLEHLFIGGPGAIIEGGHGLAPRLAQRSEIKDGEDVRVGKANMHQTVRARLMRLYIVGGQAFELFGLEGNIALVVADILSEQQAGVGDLFLKLGDSRPRRFVLIDPRKLVIDQNFLVLASSPV